VVKMVLVVSHNMAIELYLIMTMSCSIVSRRYGHFIVLQKDFCRGGLLRLEHFQSRRFHTKQCYISYAIRKFDLYSQRTMKIHSDTLKRREEV
jgi:hypothetical protein